MTAKMTIATMSDVDGDDRSAGSGLVMIVAMMVMRTMLAVMGSDRKDDDSDCE